MIKKKRVLIVDDLPELRDVLGFALKEKYSVVAADSAESALKYIADNSVNLILLDYEMPEMNGITALKKIKKRHPDIAVIMMSGHAPVDARQKAFNLGAYAFFMKPFDIDKLLNAIDEALDKMPSTGYREQ